MKALLATAAVAALLSTAVQAAPITLNSELSINGSDTFTGAVGGSTFTLDFVNPANVGGETGSFASVLSNCTGCVTMIGSLTQASTNFQLYSLTEGTNTSSLTAGTITAFSITAGAGGLENLDISGSGTLNLTGFDPTPGFYSLTTQGASGQATVTFSNTAVAAPAPPIGGPRTLLPIGMALLLLAAMRRWRQS